MPGEEPHDTGWNGVEYVSTWLQATLRVETTWKTTDHVLGDLLEFEWTHGGRTFSYDLGGKFQGSDVDGQGFAAEVKNYSGLSDLSKHYRDFLAKCYVATLRDPRRFSHYLWVSWIPLPPSSWREYRTAEKVREAVLHDDNRLRVFGSDDLETSQGLLDLTCLGTVAERIWMVTVNDREMNLVPTPEQRALMEAGRILTPLAGRF